MTNLETKIKPHLTYMDSDLVSAIECLYRVGSISSTLDKQNILEFNMNNPALKNILELTYDPYLVYYLKKVNVTRDSVVPNYSWLFQNFKMTLVKLASRELTGNEALNTVEELLSIMPVDLADICLRILKKDMDIGIKAKTINKIWPGLIPQFEVQLAKEFDGRLPQLIVLQPKLDGYRAMGSTTTGKLLSRNGKDIAGYDELEEQLRKLPPGYLIDGEIMSNNFKGTQQNAFSKSSGKHGVFNVFDIIPEDEKTESRQADRTLFLRKFLPEDKSICPNITPVDSLMLTSCARPSRIEDEITAYHPSYLTLGYDRASRVEDEITAYYSSCLALGYEGIMIKDGNAPYEHKRGYNWQKMKPVKSIDLRVIGLERGEPGSKYENTLGRLVCDYHGNEVRVGSGLSDEQRDLWWTNPTLIAMKTIEIMYQEESENEKGGRSLRFPRFKKLRPDKD